MLRGRRCDGAFGLVPSASSHARRQRLDFVDAEHHSACRAEPAYRFLWERRPGNRAKRPAIRTEWPLDWTREPRVHRWTSSGRPKGAIEEALVWSLVYREV
jgi:hypothetical protein